MSKTITKYPEGSDITILNTIYHKAMKNPDTGKWQKSSIDIIYKDNVSGTKGHSHIIDPDYHYYMLKPGVQYDYNKLFVKTSEVDEYISPESELEKDIATRTDNLEFFYSNINDCKYLCSKQGIEDIVNIHLNAILAFAEKEYKM